MAEVDFGAGNFSGFATNQDLGINPFHFGFTRLVCCDALPETDSLSCVSVALRLRRLGMGHVV